MVTIRRENRTSKSFTLLIKLLDADLMARNGMLQQSYNAHNQIDYINHVVVAYFGNEAVGCAGFKVIDDSTVEIKRMYVKPEFRGTGIANLVLTELETWAVEEGFVHAILETGINNPEAIRFYQKQGYTTIPNYPPYAGNPNSICMAREI